MRKEERRRPPEPTTIAWHEYGSVTVSVLAVVNRHCGHVNTSCAVRPSPQSATVVFFHSPLARPEVFTAADTHTPWSPDAVSRTCTPEKTRPPPAVALQLRQVSEEAVVLSRRESRTASDDWTCVHCK